MRLFVRGPATLFIEKLETPPQRRFASHRDYIEMHQGMPAVLIPDGDVGAFVYSEPLQRWVLFRIFGFIDYKTLNRWEDDGGAAG